jgi:hypothetical protein
LHTEVGPEDVTAFDDHEWMIGAVDRVEVAARTLHEAVDALVAEIAEAGKGSRALRPVDEISLSLASRDFRGTRLQAMVALDEFTCAVMLFRAGMVRALVHDANLSFTQVADRMKVSRQMVARLYQRG